MRAIEIWMRVICFAFGILLALSVKIEMHDAGAAEVFANALLMIGWLCAVVALLVLPWALSFISDQRGL